MDLIVTLNNQALHGEVGARAIAAAKAFFEAEGVTPEEAARAAWELEGALEHDQGYEISDEACRRADVWADDPDAVSSGVQRIAPHIRRDDIGPGVAAYHSRSTDDEVEGLADRRHCCGSHFQRSI